MLIDTHCHVDRFQDPLAIARDCESQRVATVAVTQLPSHFQLAMRHIGGMRYVRPALGFHPLAVAGNEDQLPLFASLLPIAQFVGEIGLDSSREGAPTLSSQVKVFRAIVSELVGKKKFVTVHSRGAEKELAEILSEFGVTECVFHWFSGGANVLKKAVDRGHYFSINTAMTSSQKGRSLLSLIPRDRVLTETDGPYIKFRGRPARPSDVGSVLSGIAEVWGQSMQEVEAHVSDNFARLCVLLGIEFGGR